MWALDFSASRLLQIHAVYPQKVTHQAPNFSKLEAAVQLVSPDLSPISLCLESRGINISEKSSRLTKFRSDLLVRGGSTMWA